MHKSIWYTGGDSAVGPGVVVTPPTDWLMRGRSGGRPARSAGWSVGGARYRTWTDAWRSAVGPNGVRRVPSAASYLRAWSVDPAVTFSDLVEVLCPAPVVAPAVQVQEVLGIDLGPTGRGHEVRKLLYAGFGLRMARSGYDPEDVLQEVYRALVVRNRGKCPFDARKSSFGHYVHMVISCVLSNYHRRENRHRTAEVSWEDLSDVRGNRVRDGLGDVGARHVVGWSDGVVLPDAETDASALSVLSARVRSSMLTKADQDRALAVLPLIQAGHAPTVRGARECGWAELEWKLAVSALRRSLGGVS